MEIVIGLVGLGIVLIILEIFLIPGITVFGFLGGAMMLAGVIYAYVEIDSTTGHITLLVSSVSLLVMFYLAYQLIRQGKVGLMNVISGQVTNSTHQVSVGDIGESQSVLRPVGIVRINEKRLEAVSIGDYIEEGRMVAVKKLEEGKIYVAETIEPAEV